MEMSGERDGDEGERRIEVSREIRERGGGIE